MFYLLFAIYQQKVIENCLSLCTIKWWFSWLNNWSPTFILLTYNLIFQSNFSKTQKLLCHLSSYTILWLHITLGKISKSLIQPVGYVNRFLFLWSHAPYCCPTEIIVQPLCDSVCEGTLWTSRRQDHSESHPRGWQLHKFIWCIILRSYYKCF